MSKSYQQVFCLFFPFFRIFHSKMQFGVELALLRTPPPLLGGREEQVASYRDEKRDDALTVHACV